MNTLLKKKKIQQMPHFPNGVSRALPWAELQLFSHHQAVLFLPETVTQFRSLNSESSPPQIATSSRRILFFFVFNIFLGVELLYNGVLVSAVSQSDSAETNTV